MLSQQADKCKQVLKNKKWISQESIGYTGNNYIGKFVNRLCFVRINKMSQGLLCDKTKYMFEWVYRNLKE